MNERLHLRWLVREAEERVKDGAAEAAKLVAERDAALSELAETRRAKSETTDALSAAQRQAVELEATLLSERSMYGARVAEAEHVAREGAEAKLRMRRLEAKLDAANVARAADGVMHEKQKLLLERLIELEGTFGAVLAPSKSATPYSLAVQELTKDELRIPAAAVRRHAALQGELAPPLLEAPLPGREAHQAAAMAASSVALGRHSEGLLPSGRKAMVPLSGAEAAMSPSPPPALPASTSLPVLRTGVRPAESVKALPVARGSARVAARKGVSIGSRSEVKQIVAMRARAAVNPTAP